VFFAKTASSSALFGSHGKSSLKSCGEWFENFPQLEMTLQGGQMQSHTFGGIQQLAGHLPCGQGDVATSEQNQTVSDFSPAFLWLCK